MDLARVDFIFYSVNDALFDYEVKQMQSLSEARKKWFI